MSREAAVRDATQHAAVPPSVPAGPGDTFVFPASFAQQRLWFLDRLEPGNPFYNTPGALRLEGDLAAAALAQTLGEVVRRHEVLRTSFATEDGQPVQVVAPAAPCPLPAVDLVLLAPALREAELARLARAEARRPFDLAAGPLLRVVLVRLAPAEHAVLLTLHHVVCDGWSLDLLVREVHAIYGAYRSGGRSPLDEPPFQYADFAVWQREWLSGDRLAAEVDHWRRSLAGVPPLLELPTDRPRPREQSYRGGRVRLEVPGAVAHALRAVAQGEGATPFMAWLAVYQVLLARRSRQQDFVVGTDVASRNRVELEGLVGFFVNQLVLRADLTGRPTFREALRRVRQATLAAYDHQDLPFEKLVDELDVPRDLSRHPLFQVSLVLQNTSQGGGSAPAGLAGGAIRVDTGINRFDLALTLTEGARKVGATLDYARDLFDASTAASLARHFVALCRAAAADPDRPVTELALLSPAERQQVVLEWNDTAAGWPLDAPFHRLFEERARRHPDRAAAVCGDDVWTYGALDRRADRWAAALARRGVGAETLVGLFVHRGFDLLTAILAVFKAGGAYLPLDPIYPPARLRQVVEQSASPLLLVGDDLAAAAEEVVAPLAPGAAPERLSLAALAAEAAADPPPSPPRLDHPAALAYVFYTSGSTGLPKGAMCDQRGLLTHLWAKRDELDLGAADVLAQNASAAFDISVWQYLAPLLVGGVTCVLPDEVAHDGGRLLAAVAQHQVTVLEMVPSPLRAVLDQVEAAGGGEALPALRWLVATGEALPPGLARGWLARYPHAPLVNAWGATETSDDVTHHVIASPPAADARGVPVGRPAGDCAVYVLEPSFEPCPPGAPGELSIGGAMVGRGYRGDPRRTAAAFVPDPFGDGSPQRPRGGRLYRTGDLGRWSRDGVVEFLGRIDGQVKIRGFRVELGEVEAVVGQHPAVDEVAVLDREHPPGVRRLVAYVVPPAGREAPSPAALREFVKARLPDYMVPAFLVALAALPVNANGKVDRRALAALPLPEVDALRVVAPRTPLESALVEVWRDVLRRERVGVEDNFFELGGDSILGIQIVTRARQAGLLLTPRHLFTHQTIAELAMVAEELAAGGAAAPGDGAAARPGGELPATPMQRRFFAASPVDPHHFNQSLLLAVRQPLAAAPLARAAAWLAARHDALRQRFSVGADGVPRVTVAAAGGAAAHAVPLHVVDLAALPSGRRRPALEAAAAAVQGALRLDRGPLARLALFELGPADGQRLLAVVHHLAVDGVSWRILLDELRTAYERLAAGAAPDAPPPAASYRRWAEAMREHAAGGAAAEAPFWRAQADRAAQVVRPLPVDRAGTATAASARTVERRFTAEDTAVLLEDLPAAFAAGVQDAVLAALVEGFFRWSGSPALWVEVEGHGREETVTGLDVSRTLGWFTAIYPLLLERESADPGALLKAVKERLRAVPERGAGYGALLWHGADDERRRLAAAPPPQVIFNYHGQVDRGVGGAAELFAPAAESAGPSQSPRARRGHLIEVGAGVAGGRLRLAWSYSESLHERAAIERLADACAAALGELVAHCRARRDADYSPSDFALAGLDQAQLDRVISAVRTPKEAARG